MNYSKHYKLLCERGKTRNIVEYTEKHHIIPRCMGGTNKSENITHLTPEEHYIAHQLLIKMYPDHGGLIWAAIQMTRHSTNKRSNNKLYGWLKRRYHQETKKRTGNKNGSYGKHWFYHPETLENIKCLPEEVPNGYRKGRRFKPNSKCVVCGVDTGTRRNKFCLKHRKLNSISVAKKNAEKMKTSPNCGNRRHSDTTIADVILENKGDIKKSMKSLRYVIGGKGNNTWKRFTRIKNLLYAE
jgi:hypothetical protein